MLHTIETAPQINKIVPKFDEYKARPSSVVISRNNRPSQAVMNTVNNPIKDNKEVIRELCSYRYNNASSLLKPQPNYVREKVQNKSILSRPAELSRNKPTYIYSVPSLNPREKRQLPITPTSNASNIKSYSIEPEYKSKDKYQSRNIQTDNNLIRALSNRQPQANIDYRMNFLLNNVQENQHATILKNLIDETLKNPPTRNIYINNQIISYNTCEPKDALKPITNQNLFTKLPIEPIKSPIYANIAHQRDKLNLFKGNTSNYRVLSQRVVTNNDLQINKTEVPQYSKVLVEPIKVSLNRMNIQEDNRSKWSISPIKIVPPKKIKMTK